MAATAWKNIKPSRRGTKGDLLVQSPSKCWRFSGVLRGALLVYTFRVLPTVDGSGVVAFNPAQQIAYGAFAALAVDVDQDGKLDIVAGHTYRNEVVQYTNDGTGAFSGGSDITENPYYEPRSLVVGDVNGDGYSDIVVPFDAYVAWYQSETGLGFSEAKDISGYGAEWTEIADFDGDGDIDVVACSNGEDRVTWHENTDGQGTFSAGVDITTSANNPTSMFAADLDGDDDIDILVSDGDGVMWFENTNGGGAFSPLPVSVEADAGFSRFVTAADLDGDGDNDIIAAFGADDQVFWYENTDGAGNFSSAKSIHVLNPEENSVQYRSSYACVAAVDLDNDGDLDLVASSVGSEEISWFENMDGEGTFSAANIVGIVTPGIVKVIAADLDDDGDLDVVAASLEPGSGSVTWYENLLIDAEDIIPATTPPASTSDDATNLTSSPTITPPTNTPATDEEGAPTGDSYILAITIGVLVPVFSAIVYWAVKKCCFSSGRER